MPCFGSRPRTWCADGSVMNAVTTYEVRPAGSRYEGAVILLVTIAVTAYITAFARRALREAVPDAQADDPEATEPEPVPQNG